MGIFKPKLVDKYVIEWQFESFELLINNFSAGAGLPNSDLWLPCDEHFGAHSAGMESLRGRALANFIFDRIKQQCGFASDNPIQLVPTDERKPQSLGGVAMVQTNANAACGRYIVNENEGQFVETITYDRDLEKQPSNLIATLAHELSHALHCRSQAHLPIEDNLYEMFTDLTAIYLGYGVFIANSRFEFSQFQDSDVQGWQMNGAGYLPEADIVFALALFMSIKNIDETTASLHLKPRLKKPLAKAFKQLSQYENEIESLRKLVPNGG